VKTEPNSFLNRYGRFELKYVITTAQGKSIRERLGHFMSLDTFASQHGFYINRSLYFDTPDLKEYMEYVDGEKRRRKVRLRRYLLEDNKVNIELKQKLDRIIWKDKVKLDLEKAVNLITSPWDWVENENTQLAEIAQQIVRYDYQPKATVTYQRIPYHDVIDGRVRITFDYNIRCGEAEMFLREVTPDDLRVLPPGFEVLELKFTRFCPNWVRNIIDDFSLSPTTYSKYAKSIDRLKFKSFIRSVK